MDSNRLSFAILVLLLFPLAQVIYGAISTANATILSTPVPVIRGRQPIIKSVAIYGKVSTLYRKFPYQIRYQEASTSNIITIEQDYMDLESPHLRIKFDGEGRALPLKKHLPANVGLIAFKYDELASHDMECVQANGNIFQSLCLMLTKSSDEMDYFRTVAKDLLDGVLTARPVAPGGFMVCVELNRKDANIMEKSSFTETKTALAKDSSGNHGKGACPSRVQTKTTCTSEILLQENQNQKKRRKIHSKEIQASPSHTVSKVTTPSSRLELILRQRKPGIYFGASFSYGYLKPTTKYSDQVITVEDEARRATVMSRWLYFYNPQIEISLNNETGFLTVTREPSLSPSPYVRVFVANIRRNLTYRMESGIWPMLSYICIASSPDPRITTSLQANAVNIIKNAFKLDNLPRGSILVCSQIVKSMLRDVPSLNERKEPESTVPGVLTPILDHGKTTEPDPATAISTASQTPICPEFYLTDSIFRFQEDLNRLNDEESHFLDDMHSHLLETFGDYH